MSELEEKLENILGNPQAMAQIASLAQSLNLSGPAASAGDGAKAQEPPPASVPSPAPPESAPSRPQASAGAGEDALSACGS